MRVWLLGVLWASGLAVCTACTLFVDEDSLTSGLPGAGAAAAGSGGQDNNAGGATQGAAGQGVSNGGFGAAKCVVATSDVYCDGLDEQCTPTLLEAACPDGCSGSTLNGVSYMACTTSSSFDQAELRCQAQHMHLVKIASAAENNYVVQLAQMLGSYVWIGGSNRAQVSTYAWPDGSAFYDAGAPVAGAYQNFGPDQPTPDATKSCVQIHDDASGFWLNAHCADAEQFICERY